MRLPLVALTAVLAAAPALAVPLELPAQGRLLDSDGVPLDGEHTLTFALHDAPSSGDLLWSDAFTVILDNGYYAVALGSQTALDAALFDEGALFLGVSVDDEPELSVRQPLGSVPFAIRAGQARDLVGGVVDATEIRINGALVVDGSGELVTATDTLAELSCADGQVAVFASGAWTCGDRDLEHVHDAAEISTGTLSVARLPIGTGEDDVAAGNHTHDLGALPGQLLPDQLPADMSDRVEGWVTDGPLNLDPGTTVGGQPVATGYHYTDADAVAAMGGKASDNALHHDRYTDGEAVAAVRSANRSWTLVHQDMFTQSTSGWSDNTLTSCGAYGFMLGRHAGDTLTRTFEELPEHSELRIVLDYHFIDSWDGEEAFLTVDGERRWAASRPYTAADEPNACGTVGHGDIMGFPVEVYVPHTADSFVLGLGSTLNQPVEDESWGIDNLRIYVR